MRINFQPLIYAVALACGLALAHGVGARPQDKQPPAADEDRIYRQSEVDQKAVLDRRSRADNFPTAYGCEDRQGTVRLRGVLRKTGKVTDVFVLRRSGCEDFDRRAIKSTQKIKFTPAVKDGAAVSQYMTFEYNYRNW